MGPAANPMTATTTAHTWLSSHRIEDFLNIRMWDEIAKPIWSRIAPQLHREKASAARLRLEQRCIPETESLDGTRVLSPQVEGEP
jgi:hypothetical protein